MISELVEYLGTDDEKELISLSDGKGYMRVEFTHEDDLIKSQIQSAIQSCENFTRRAFLLQRRKMTLFVPSSIRLSNSGFSPFYDGLDLHFGPVASPVSLTMLTQGTTFGTMTSGTDYWITNDKLFISRDLTERKLIDNGISALTLVYTCGMEKAAFKTAYPNIVEAIKMTLHSAWDGRGFSSMNVPPQAKQKLAPYKNILISDV